MLSGVMIMTSHNRGLMNKDDFKKNTLYACRILFVEPEYAPLILEKFLSKVGPGRDVNG